MPEGLEAIQRYWDEHARRDPLWAILSDPAKKDGKWDVRRFFQTGTDEIALLFYELDRLGVVLEHDAAMDFGCGVGRLTQALAPRFNKVVGVDVSPRMLELAEGLNLFRQNVSYVSNQAADLRMFRDDEFDLVVSLIVLQHLQPEIALLYLREFFRALKPGGVLVFQLPSHARPSDDSPFVPMPDDAYRASFVVRELPAGPLKPGSQTTLQVEVTNNSKFAWSQHAHGSMRLGNHWLDAAGDRMLLRDDGRMTMPGELDPGASCCLPLTVTAPLTDGDYLCEIDLAHEGVVWFRDKGSAGPRCVVRVRAHDDLGHEPDVPGEREPNTMSAAQDARDLPSEVRPLEGGAARAGDPGDFPMHGIHADTITQLIASHGASLLHKEADRGGGKEWVSYWYFVRNQI